MTRRRQLLAALGAGAAGSLAGCNAIRGVIGGGGGPGSVASTETWRAPEGTAEATGLSSSGGPDADAEQAAVAEFRDGIDVGSGTSPLVGDDGVYEVTRRASPYEDDPPVFRVYAHAHAREDGSERWRKTVFETEETDGRPEIGRVAGALGPERLYALRGTSDRTTVSVTALSRGDGSREWSEQFSRGFLQGQPVVHDDTLYLFGEPGLVAVDVADGSVRWERRVIPQQRHPVVGEGAVAVYNVGVGGSGVPEGQLTVFEADDGAERWSEPFPNAQTGAGPTPTIADGSVYLIEGDSLVQFEVSDKDRPPRKLHARALEDGSEEWTHTYETDAMADSVAVGGTSFVTVAGDRVYFALAFGTPEQIVGPQGDPAELERLEGRIYDGPNVFALDRSDGSVVWETKLGEAAQVFRPLVADDEHLYARRGIVGGDSISVHVLNRESGDAVGSIGEFSGRGPIGVADGDLYVHDEDRVRIFR